MKDVFKFVLVGTGNIANSYVNSIEKMNSIEIVAVVSRSGKKPEAIKKENIEVASSVKEVKTNFDAVLIATPNGTHHVAAIEAARMGKHVLCEKVLDISLDACDAMIAACEKNKVKLGVTYQRRFKPVNKQIKAALNANAFGEVFSVELEAKFLRDQAYYDSASYRGNKEFDGGGPFMQQASHDVDLMIWFFGMPANLASVMGTYTHDIESEDHGAVIMRFDSGMLGTLIASTSCKPGSPAKITIRSDKGTLVLSGDEIAEMEMDGVTTESIACYFSDDDAPVGNPVVADFVNAVRNDLSPGITGEDARRSVKLIREIYEKSI
jgi:predicted dehydrogenase